MKVGVVMDEAIRFTKLLNENNSVTFFGNTSKFHLEKFSRLVEISKFMQFERPDIVIESSGFVYFFECFEFDSSNNSKKGTEMRKEEAKVQREFDQHVQQTLKKEPDKTVFHKTTYQSDRSVDCYIDNFIRNFSTHYDKIEEYKSNCKVNILEKDYEFGFIIENTSILPDIVLKENGDTSLLLPIHLTKILNFLKTKSEVKNIFYITPNGGSGYSIFYFRNAIDFYSEIIELGLSINDNEKLIDWKANSIGFVVPIPKIQ